MVDLEGIYISLYIPRSRVDAGCVVYWHTFLEFPRQNELVGNNKCYLRGDWLTAEGCNDGTCCSEKHYGIDGIYTL